MLIPIKKVLDSKQLKLIQRILKTADFIDGRLSAGKEASSVKHNSELAADNPIQQQLNSVLMPNLLNNPTFQSATLPIKVSSPFY